MSNKSRGRPRVVFGTLDVDTGIFTATQNTGTGKVKAFYTAIGAPTRSDAVDVAVYRLGIEEIWSDQFPGVKANYLPGGAGSKEKEYEYILMGARSDEKAYAKAKIRIEPDVDFVRDRVLARSARNTTPEGEETIETTSEGNIASMWIDDIYQDDYTVVAGLDLNDNHQLDEDEISATTEYKLKIISGTRYTTNQLYLIGLLNLTPERFSAARSFLDCYLYDKKKMMWSSIVAIPVDIDISVNDPYHNVGVVFTASGTGKARKFLFPTSSYLSRKLLRSKDLAVYIQRNLPGKKREVQKYFEDNPKEQTHTFPWEFSNGTTFGYSVDLGMAFGEAKLDLNVEAKVRRKDLKLIQLKLRGTVKDFYQWDYEQDARPAVVQAGYDTLGSAGHIYRVTVYLDGVVTGIDYSFE